MRNNPLLLITVGGVEIKEMLKELVRTSIIMVNEVAIVHLTNGLADAACTNDNTNSVL